MNWGNSSYYTYILAAPGFAPKAFDAKLKEIVKKYHTEDWRDRENPHRYYVQPLKDIHLYSHINFDIGKNNDIRYIYLLSGLAVIIMLPACINYMNLTAALIALLMVELFLPTFSKLVERVLTFDLLLQGKAFAGLLLAISFVGLISGSYPALLLTAFQPAKVLKAAISRGRFQRIQRRLTSSTKSCERCSDGIQRWAKPLAAVTKPTAPLLG